MRTTMDMTEGQPVRHLIRFALPMLFTSVFQVLYTLVDSVVVGRLLGIDTFAAIGATWFWHWLLLDTMMGISHGFGTHFGQRFGAKDLDGLRVSFAMAILLTVGLGMVFCIGGVLLSEPVLKWLGTPETILLDAAVYLRFLTGGLWIAFMHHVLGAMLRGMGDSQTPFYAVLLSSVLNIVLDLLLVAVIPIGVRGVALATLLSQMAACVFCALRLGRVENLRLKRADFRWDPDSVKPLLRLGLPLGFRNCVVSFGGLVSQYVINGYGVIFVAGISAARRLNDLLFMMGGVLEGAVSTFVAQNSGAKMLRRVHQSVAISRRILLISSAVIIVLTFLAGRMLLSLFVTGEPESIQALLDVAQRQLLVTACGLPMLYLLFLYRSALQGLGNTFMPMLSGFLELILRIVCMLWLTPLIGQWGVYLADAAGWVAAALQLFLAYKILFQNRLAIEA